MPLEDYGALLQSGYNSVPDYSKQLAFQVGLQQEKLQNQLIQSQIASAATKQQRAHMFDQDLASAMSDPRADNISALIMKYPEFADQIKGGWDVRDKAANQADLTTMGEIYSAASSGNTELAAKIARQRYEADKASGNADPGDLEVVSALESGDPEKVKSAIGMIGVHIAAKTGPEHFGSVYGSLKGGFHIIPEGGIAIDDKGNVVAQSPIIKDAQGNVFVRDGSEGGGGGTSTPAPAVAFSNLPKPAADVAGVLSNAGYPAPVVAGFLGNFHVEGGYGGAQGDGGSASGVAQWHDDRAANFERVIGKPVSEATPAEQAKFVVWEMNNPEAAGMTVEQRDAILGSKTPAQAAALIDQHYERSSGAHRQRRMTAATNVFNGQAPTGAGSAAANPAANAGDAGAPSGYHLMMRGKPQPTRMTPDEVQAEGLDPNTVYYRDANGVPQAISGQSAGKDKYRLLTTAEKQERGLDPALQFQLNEGNGQVAALGGQSKQAKQIPQQVQSKAQPAIDIRDTMNRLAGNWKNDFGGHTILGGSINSAQSWVNVGPEGMRDWWADFQGMDNQVRNQLFGSALTEHEKAAYEATTISPRMSSEQIRKNFNRRRAIINGAVARQQNFLKKNGYDPEAVDALFAPLGGGGGSAPAAPASAPVRVRSVQEAQRLPSGTLFVTPDGRTMRKR